MNFRMICFVLSIISVQHVTIAISKKKRSDFFQQIAFSGNKSEDARKNIKKYIVQDESVFKDFEYKDMQVLAHAFGYRWDQSYIMVVCHLQERGYFDEKHCEEPKKWYDLVDQYKNNYREFEDAVEKRNHKKLKSLVKKGIVFEMEVCKALEHSKSLEQDYNFFLEVGIDSDLLDIFLADVHWRKAISRGNGEKVQELIAKGCSLNKATFFTLPPLFLAVMCENISIIKQLIEVGADVNLRLPGREEMPLMMAVADWVETFSLKRIKQVIEVLVAHCAHIDAQDATGKTALMKAMKVNNKVAFETLLECGADTRIKNNKGLTVENQIVKITKKHGTSSTSSRNEYYDILKKYKKS